MTARDLRIVFAGTPDFAAAHLDCLLRKNFTIVSAYSQPDRPSGRGKKILPTPVRAVAQAHGVPVFQPESFDEGVLADLREQKPDVMVVVAYGLLLPESVLSLPTFGCINVHASLLPRWRGAAPIERAILTGDAQTGVSIMQMDAGLDTGPVLKMAATPILDADTSATLTTRLQELGCGSLCDVLERIAAGTAQPEAQNDSLALYARKLKKEEAAIDWQRDARHIHQQIRAFYPRSPAYCFHPSNQRLRIIAAERDTRTYADSPPGTVIEIRAGRMLVACGEGSLFITEVQMEGKPPMSVPALLNGHPGFFRAGQALLSAGDHVPAS